jgi:hypothetical protein
MEPPPSAITAYYGFAASRDGIRFNGWHQNKGERWEKIRRFRSRLLYLQKHLQNDKVEIVDGPQNVLLMDSPDRLALLYVDPPYYVGVSLFLSSSFPPLLLFC